MDQNYHFNILECSKVHNILFKIERKCTLNEMRQFFFNFVHDAQKKMRRIWPLTIAYSRSFCMRYFAHYHHDIEEVNKRKGWKSFIENSDILDMFVKMICCQNQLWHPFLIDFAAAGYLTGEREPSYSVIMMKLSTARTSVREWKVFSKRNSHAVINSHLIRTRQSRGEIRGDSYTLYPFTVLSLYTKIEAHFLNL